MMDWLSIVAPAWLAGSLLVLLSAPLGCLVLWRKMAFFSDTLAHGALFGVAIATWLGLPADFGVVTVSLLVVLVLTWLHDKRLPNDALLAVVASSLLCLGLLTLTQLSQQQANVLGFLFGSLLEITWTDLPRLATLVGLGLIILYKLWQPQLKLATSSELATIQGINARAQRLFFMGLLAGFCAIALQAVGSLLISGLLILPAMTARLYAKSPKAMALIALAVGQLGVSVGLWGSVWLDIQTGLAIVLTLGVTFFINFAFKRNS